MSFQIFKKNLLLIYFLVSASILFGPMQLPAIAADVGVANFSWLPNTETDIAGYKIHYGTNHNGPYDLVADIGNPSPVNGRIQGHVTGLVEGTTYFFVATAYNDAGLESEYSTEVEYSIPLPPPIDSTPPTGSIIIEGGATGTVSNLVSLTLSASDSENEVTQMQFSNNNVDWSAPETYTAEKSWELSDGLGLKTVYARFKDGVGNWSSSSSDSIEFYQSSGKTILGVFGSTVDVDFQETIVDTYLNLNAENNLTNVSLNTLTWPADTVANAIVMKIDLSKLPAGIIIENAVLSLYMNDAGGDDLYDVAIHKIINHNPNMELCTGHVYDGTNTWTANDSCYNSIPLAQADLAVAEESISLDKTYGYKSWNVKEMVSNWVSNPETNFGLLLNSDKTAGNNSYRNFASSEAPNPNQRPRLVITYTISTKPGAPSGFIVID